MSTGPVHPDEALAPTDPGEQPPRKPKATAQADAELGLEPTEDTPATPAAQRPPLSNPGEQLPFASWERYKLISFLGAGGMGSVYKAHDPRLNRNVAIKFLRTSQVEQGDVRQRRRFEREARAQAGIEHPHICKIYQVGEVEGQPYIAMQLISGSSLGGLYPVMSREQKARAIQQIAEALHAAHDRGLVHRDIKPGNILVERRPDCTWWPYLMDFGLVREVDADTMTTTGGIEGTPAFMAPEQARGETRLLDRRTDVYGLGAALYYVLAGRPPFLGNTSAELLLDVLVSDPPSLRKFDPTIPVELETIAFKCMEKDPRRRYDSAKDLAADLGRFLEGHRIEARPPGLLRRAGRFVQRHKLLVASAATALVASVVLGGLALRIRWQAAQQARLAEHLGQEITKMEWLLRSARQLPLHDLGREKVIVRHRMDRLQAEVATYGERSRGLAHYALGRGYMALHEYPQALTQLQLAIQLGVHSPEVDYALGFVLGKHYEQAIYEARLSGGGDWAKKQLKEIEPKYLTPAIASLSRSRAMRVDSPQYLEGLIAFYQRDYDRALQQAAEALREAPWLYEAWKLSGDVHLERALQARDSGRYEEAESEFVAAVKGYDEAAAVGQSDGEVYEGLAEVWVRQIDMKTDRGQPADEEYAAALKASDKVTLTEPDSIAGPLKAASASNMTMSQVEASLQLTARIRTCLAGTRAVLEKQPENPYASDLAATCHSYEALEARTRGEDPKPLLRKAISLLEPTLAKYPKFLWGINDLGAIYYTIGTDLSLHGDPSARSMMKKSMEQFAAAAALDPTVPLGPQNVLGALRPLMQEAISEDEELDVLSLADDWLSKCKSINSQAQQCYDNYFQIYAHAASRAFVARRDPRPRVKVALDNLTETRKLGGSLLDAEQIAALVHLVDANDRVRTKQDPSPALSEIQTDLSRCFTLAPHDVMCQTLAAQAEWVQADWLAAQNKSAFTYLESGLRKAELATQNPEKQPDAWQTLAEAHLRIARTQQNQPKLRDLHIVAGLSAAEKIFAINPNHALGLGTQGTLLLLKAQAEPNLEARQVAAQEAAQAFEKALNKSPLMRHDYAPLLESARSLDQTL